MCRRFEARRPRQAHGQRRNHERGKGHEQTSDPQAPAQSNVADRSVDLSHAETDSHEVEMVRQPAEWPEQLGVTRRRAHGAVGEGDDAEPYRHDPRPSSMTGYADEPDQ